MRSSRGKRNRSIALIAVLLALARQAAAQNVYTWTSMYQYPWGRSGNWTGGPAIYPGLSARGNNTGGADTDIARIDLAGPQSLAINFESLTSGTGVGPSLKLGAIDYAPSTNSGNSLTFTSAAAATGVLSFTGASLHGETDVVLANYSPGTANFTIGSSTANATQTMSLVLDAGNNTILTSGGTATAYGSAITLYSPLSGSSSGGSDITFLGGGSSTVNGGTLAIKNGTVTSVNSITVGRADGTQAGRLDLAKPAAMPAGSVTLTVNRNSQLLLEGLNGETIVYGTAGQTTLHLNGAGTPSNPGALIYANGAGPGNVTFVGSVVLDSDSAISVVLPSDSTSRVLTLSGPVTGSATLTKVGTGTLVLSGANRLTGGTIVRAGTLQVNAGSSIGTGDLTIAPTTGTALLDLNGATTTVGNLSTSFTGTGSATAGINIGAGARLTVVQTANTRFGIGANFNQAPALNGTGTFVLDARSTGMLTLDYRLNFDGDVVIDGGTLNVNAALRSGNYDNTSAAGTVRVNAGGTLSGTGEIPSAADGGAVVVNGGILSPGDAGSGIGTLSLTSLVLGPDAVLNFQIGTVADKLQIAKYLFASAGAGDTVVVGFSDAGGLTVGQTYVLATFGPGQKLGAGFERLTSESFHAAARDNLSAIDGTFAFDDAAGQLRFTPTSVTPYGLDPTPAAPAPLALLIGVGVGALRARKRLRSRERLVDQGARADEGVIRGAQISRAAG